jgi:hypothetical protein
MGARVDVTDDGDAMVAEIEELHGDHPEGDRHQGGGHCGREALERQSPTTGETPAIVAYASASGTRTAHTVRPATASRLSQSRR